MRLENIHWILWLTGSVNKWFTIGLRYTNSDIIEETCVRVYDIRCKIVHKKANGKDGEVILPYSLDIENLKNDIRLIEFIAKQVLLENSKKFEADYMLSFGFKRLFIIIHIFSTQFIQANNINALANT